MLCLAGRAAAAGLPGTIRGAGCSHTCRLEWQERQHTVLHRFWQGVPRRIPSSVVSNELSKQPCTPEYELTSLCDQTLAYLLPVLHTAVQRSAAEWKQTGGAAFARKNREELGRVQAIVIAPSRELAMQIMRTAQLLLPPSARNAVQQCIGGANVHRQVSLQCHQPAATHKELRIVASLTTGRVCGSW